MAVNVGTVTRMGSTIDGPGSQRRVYLLRHRGDSGRATRCIRIPLGENRDDVRLPVRRIHNAGVVGDGRNFSGLVCDANFARKASGDPVSKLLEMRSVEDFSGPLRVES